jgi:hypothetical protein
MTRFPNLRSATTWRGIGVVILVSGTVVLASMGLVSFRNRNRGATKAVQWAVERLDRIPEDTVVRVYTPAVFFEAVGEFHQAIRDHAVPVDSIRQFYHAFTLWARDGYFTAQEVADLGPFLSLPSGTVSIALPTDTVDATTDSTGFPSAE